MARHQAEDGAERALAETNDLAVSTTQYRDPDQGRHRRWGEMPTTPGRRAARVPGVDELRLLTKVARLYHEKGIRQPQIAQTLNLSQARVSRMLKQAEQLGIVKTVVTMPPGVHGELEDQLQARYALQDVVVVDADDSGDVRSALGAATAAYLGVTLTRRHVVGITSWSESVLAAVERMQSGGQQAERVVQMLGGLGVPTGPVHANRLITEFAAACGATPILMPAPGLVSDPAVKGALAGERAIASVMADWDTITDALVGIGGIEPTPLLARSGNGVSDTERSSLRALGAVGDICFRYFDADGRPVHSSLDDRVMGISPEQFLNIPRRIGVCGGDEKLEAVRGAARGGWITVLITDRELAEQLTIG